MPIIFPQNFIVANVLRFPQFRTFKIMALGRKYPPWVEGADQKMAMGIEAAPIAVFSLCHELSQISLYLSKLALDGCSLNYHCSLGGAAIAGRLHGDNYF